MPSWVRRKTPFAVSLEMMAESFTAVFAPLVTKMIFSTPCALRAVMPLRLAVSTAKSSSTVTVSTPSLRSAVQAMSLLSLSVTR